MSIVESETPSVRVIAMAVDSMREECTWEAFDSVLLVEFEYGGELLRLPFRLRGLKAQMVTVDVKSAAMFAHAKEAACGRGCQKTAGKKKTTSDERKAILPTPLKTTMKVI